MRKPVDPCLFNVEQPCRLEKIETVTIPTNKHVYLDVCHNEQGVSAVMNELKKLSYCVHKGCSKVTVLCLFSKNKDTQQVLELIGRHLEDIRDKLSVPAECYPLGNVDHFRLLSSRQLFE